MLCIDEITYHLFVNKGLFSRSSLTQCNQINTAMWPTSKQIAHQVRRHIITDLVRQLKKTSGDMVFILIIIIMSHIAWKTETETETETERQKDGETDHTTSHLAVGCTRSNSVPPAYYRDSHIESWLRSCTVERGNLSPTSIQAPTFTKL